MLSIAVETAPKHQVRIFTQETRISSTYLAQENIPDIVVLVRPPESRHSLRNPLRSAIIIPQLPQPAHKHIIPDEMLQGLVRPEDGRKPDKTAQVMVGAVARVRSAQLAEVVEQDRA